MEINPEWESEKTLCLFRPLQSKNQKGTNLFLLLIERAERFLFSGTEVGGLVSSSLQCNKLEGKRLFLSEESTHMSEIK